MKTKLFFSALILMALTTLAGAQDNPVQGRLQDGNARGQSYVDRNNNGTCDNYEKGGSQTSCNYRNGTGKWANRQAMGMHQGQPAGQVGGRNFRNVR